MLVRRNAWLFAFGLVHGVLLFSGDILGAYGLVGIGFTLLLLQRGHRVYRVPLVYLAFAAMTVVVLAVVVAAWLVSDPAGPSAIPTSDSPSMAAGGFTAAIAARLTEWPLTVLSMLPFVLFVWVGAWAARQRVLEELQDHRRLLRWGAATGLGVAVAGGLPMGLLAGGFLQVDAETGPAVKLLYEASGFFGGIGYLCLFGLLALALTRSRRKNVVVGALAALGQRSLSGYLFQTLAWTVLASPFLLSLGPGSASPTFTAAIAAVAVWLSTVVAAYAMQRRAYRGPAETVLRRLTYGRRDR
ncbi:DUF418 domain-containing protein [Amycolatopsis sp. NPDC051371]|uniref:DUF418 domain-containing protein n=1 Tax=Amycolatopsis sp. NPDC051371 TaxID=3155800 RepID=UPI0034391BBC